MAAWTPQEEEERLANYLFERVTGRASGRLESECLFNMPRDRYFIGNLRSAFEEENHDHQERSILSEMRNKLAPVAFGAEFLLEPSENHFEISTTVEWACYYRVFPTFKQQSDFLNRSKSEQTEMEPEEKAETEKVKKKDVLLPEEPDERAHRRELEAEMKQAKGERKRKREKTDALCPRYRKIVCSARADLILSKTQDKSQWHVDDTHLKEALKSEIERAIQNVQNDPEAIKTSDKDIDTKIKIPDNASTSEASYQAAVSALTIPVLPQWQWQIDAKVQLESKKLFFAITLVNTSPMPSKSSTRESYFFDTCLSLQFDKVKVFPFELELAPKGFRYDRQLWGKGFNCAVKKLSDHFYRTTHTPVYRQMRYETQKEPEARFDELAKNPLSVLSKILTAMQNYNYEWKEAERLYRKQYGDTWNLFQDEFQQDWERFHDETRRFERGLRLIENDETVRLAFQLTNEVFRRTGDHPISEKQKEKWRLFQIVFWASQIPGIVALLSGDSENISERELVDIVYFPTGGGKTEAYLAVLVFHCFFDRLRGKTAGVTAWTRFPLRLLTLQQTQRIADVIGMAELVRCEQKDQRLNGSNVDGFAVGYFVGREATPNKLTPSNKPEEAVDWSRARDEKERQVWKRIVTCPACRTTSITVDFDETTVNLVHRCKNSKCAFPNGILPVYVVDNEIYRNLPCVVVGTIDKLAGIGNERKFSLIFGQVIGKCSLHGYYNGKCCQPECKETKLLKPGRPKGISGPTLFVQDELHLLREGLGTFDAHYETFTQELLRQFGQTQTIKIIASSATIEAFERQVEHLYGRQRSQARIFPGTGPSLTKSFYAETLEYVQRLYVGIIPHNKTIFNSILELLQYYHEETQHLLKLQSNDSNPYAGSIQPGTSEWRQLIDFYLTSLTYFLAGRDLSSIRTDLEAAVNSELSGSGYRELLIKEMTGGTATNEVTDILEKVERAHVEGTTPDAILATSMISHGIDVDRFNAMLFYGMPRQNAEYIQSSSRIGRSHVGLVLTCLHPARERDQSHYSYFVKYHEFLGQMIEPVAINRWSKFSAERTLPGLFMAVLLQLLANSSRESSPNSYYMLNFVKKKISSGEITPNEFIPLLEEAYRVTHPSNPAEQSFHEEIRSRVQMFFDQIGSAAQQTFVSDALIPKPMRSLRDVDETIAIELDDAGSRWISRSE